MFKIIFRILGLLFLAICLVAIVVDSGKSISEGQIVLTRLGEVWSWLSPDTLLNLQAGIQRNVSPFLWNEIFFPLLFAPGALIAAILAIFFLWFGRSPRGKNRYGSAYLGETLGS